MEKYNSLDKNSLHLKLQLSNLYQLEKDFNNNFYLICEKIKKKYVVNESIYNYLELFKKPISINDSINKYSEKVKKKHNIICEKDVKKKLLKLSSRFTTEKILIPNNSRAKAYIDFEVSPLEIEGYNIIKCLSERKKGEIHLISKDGVFFILKTLLRTRISEKSWEKELLKFKKEFYRLSLFNHDFICKVYNKVEENERGAYAIMEYITGNPINAAMVVESKKINEKIDLFTNVLTAFSKIHKEKIVHGDIHFENIIVTNDNKIKVIDFGLSNFYDNEKQERINSGGIPVFVAPEKINFNTFKRYNKINSFRTDVYSIGIIFLYVFFNEIPNFGSTWKELYINKKTFSVNEYAEKHKIQKEVTNFIKKTLNPKPEMRFYNCETMLDEWFKIKSLIS